MAICPPMLLSLAFVTCYSCAVVSPFETNRKRGHFPANLPILTSVVAVLGVTESMLGLWPIVSLRWTKTCCIGFLLKYVMLDVFADIRNSVANVHLLRLWLYTYRMGRDMVVS